MIAERGRKRTSEFYSVYSVFGLFGAGIDFLDGLQLSECIAVVAFGLYFQLRTRFPIWRRARCLAEQERLGGCPDKCK
jgi:hypothetical protein